jgi:protein SCO1/2
MPHRILTLVFFLALPLAAKTYAVDGIVIAVDPAARTMLVSHRPIAHYMPAMLMPFQAEDPAELAGLHPGARIRFELSVTKARTLARHIQPSGEADAALPALPQKLAPGAPLPDFALTDHNGRTVHIAGLRGKVVAIDFIYTRCPLPDVCPRLSANFAMLQHRFAKEDLVLLSVTVDPDFDTPHVLADYARRWAAGPAWLFLTGNVAPLAGALGEIYWADEGSIGHNSTTTILGRDGRLAAVLEGSNFRPDQLAHLIAHELENHP